MNAVKRLKLAPANGEVLNGPRVTSKDSVLDLAREAGMTVMLDACIGRERYHSVTGSCAALERFARACRHGAARTTDKAPARTTLELWARACEQGRSRAVARAIRAWLRESKDVGHTIGQQDCGGK